MRRSHNAKFPLVVIQVSVNEIKCIILDCEHSLKERCFWYGISYLIGRGIDFDQWEFYVAWARRISFLPVLSAVSPFPQTLSFSACSQSGTIAIDQKAVDL